MSKTTPEKKTAVAKKPAAKVATPKAKEAALAAKVQKITERNAAKVAAEKKAAAKPAAKKAAPKPAVKKPAPAPKPLEVKVDKAGMSQPPSAPKPKAQPAKPAPKAPLPWEADTDVTSIVSQAAARATVANTPAVAAASAPLPPTTKAVAYKRVGSLDAVAEGKVRFGIKPASNTGPRFNFKKVN